MKRMVVGIPRALFYFKYHVLWETFFEELGIETLVSPPTRPSILEAGLQGCVAEACLPLKVYFGHVLALRGKADCVFIPRYISVHKGEFICPKFGGLPDMIRHALPDAPPILEVEVNHHSGDKNASLRAAVGVGKQLGIAPKRAQQAFACALERHGTFRAEQAGRMEKPIGVGEGPRILVLGHAYNVLDSAMNMNLVQRLREMGAAVLTVESFDGRLLRSFCGHREEPLFWTLGAEILGAAYYALEGHNVEGVLYLTSFGCGLDAFVENMVSRRMHEQGMPYMALMMDEHTAEAGVLTRLEAFMDTLAWRDMNDTYISPDGECHDSYQSTAG